MNNGLIVLTAALMVLTGIGHSWLGERKVISAMLAITDGKVLSRLQKRFLRACWHIGTISWVAAAAMLLCLSLPLRELQFAVLMINGFAFVLIGALNLLISGGRNPGWVACLLVAVASVAAAVLL
jgi:hypothetical protein